jgi:hypothetical protein
MTKWFKTWNRPEYKEWATPSKEGYILLVINKEEKRYLCVKALLIMKSVGLPEFKTLTEVYFSKKSQAEKQILDWKK